MAGIVFAWHAGASVPLLLLLCVVSLLALLSAMFDFLPKWFFGAAVFSFLFSCGVFVGHRQHEEKISQWSSEKLLYKASLVEVPLFRGTSVKVLADVEAVDTVLQPGVRSKGLVYLYFSRSVSSDTLDVGDVISFKSRVNPFRNAGNPAEFDVENYNYIKGITGSAFIYDGSWSSVGECERTLQMHALSLREKISGIYSSLEYDDDVQALLSALTLGEKRDFPQRLKESYAKAGASHVLALSGLHLGIFYMLLLFLLPYNGQNRVLVISRELLVIALLWGYAFVAGLSPSVVRAAILFSIMSVARCLRREGSSVNSLALAAMLMLLVEPHLLFDVSFQLSFSAVLSILLLAPPLQKMMKLPEHGAIYGYVVNLLILSFAAQVGTLPFIWYYFGVFPLYFLLTNIFVVPFAFVVMLLAVVVWILVPAPFVQAPFAWLLGLVGEVMNAVVTAVAQLPGASYRLPQADVASAVALAAILLFVVYTVSLGKKSLFLFSISSLAAFFAVCVLFQDNAEEGNYLLIYNNRKNPLVHAVAEGGRNYLVSSVPQDDAEYEYSSLPYINREELLEPAWACYSYSDSLLCVESGMLSFNGIRLMMLDNGIWEENEYVEPVDVLLLCRGFLGNIERLIEYYPTECIVLDASLYSHSRNRIMRECDRLGVDAVDVSSCGAVKIVPADDSFFLDYMSGK